MLARRKATNIQVVLGFDDETPSSPDDTGTHQGKVTLDGNLLGGKLELGKCDGCKTPLHHRCLSALVSAPIVNEVVSLP